MTVTPKNLRDIANSGEPDPWVAATERAEALLQAADEIERLAAPRRMTTKPHDDCECVVCETMRNPPPPTEFAKELMRKAKQSQGWEP